MRPLWVCALSVTGCLLAQTPVQPGVERWAVKTLGPEGVAAPRNIALAELLAFADLEGVTRNDSRFQAHRIPLKVHGDFQEGQLVTVTGYLHLVAGEGDGDYHIQISDSPASGDHCLIVEVPSSAPEFVNSTELRPKLDAVRAFLKQRTLAGREPAAGGSIMRHPPHVSVTGVLFYDDSHVGDAPRGKRGMKAATLWELHPVVAMQFAP